MNSLKLTAFSAVLLAISIQGCTGSGGVGSRETVYPVTGKVTLGGAPVANASVTFSPEGKQPVPVGRTDAEGQYSLMTYDASDGAAAGDYIVLITKEAPPAATGGAPPAHGVNAASTPVGHAGRGKKQGSEPTGSLLPGRYGDPSQTDLKATVKADGDNKFDFDLKP